MTAPAPAKPAFQPAADFGPDFTKTVNDLPPPKEPRKQSKPSPLSNLGANTKPRSGVRKLSDDDRSTLEAWYRRIAKISRPFRPQLADALDSQAEDCARTWCELAETNDKVRRAILGIIEGGEWGRVIAAHTPIFIAVIPESVVEKVMMRSFELFARTTADESEEDGR